MSNQEKSWIRTREIENKEVDDLVTELKTISSFDKDKWIKLARILKKSGDLQRAEMAYVAARYTDLDDRDLMREWLAVYTVNRVEFKSKNDILREANLIEEGMNDVRLDTIRMLDEIQHLLFMLERAQ